MGQRRQRTLRQDVCEEVLGEAAPRPAPRFLNISTLIRCILRSTCSNRCSRFEGRFRTAVGPVAKDLARADHRAFGRATGESGCGGPIGLSPSAPRAGAAAASTLPAPWIPIWTPPNRRGDGRIALAPRRMIFRTPARRHMDWHLIFVVDVSGSMDASVIYSALVAAIFSRLPAIDVRFFAFSTGGDRFVELRR